MRWTLAVVALICLIGGASSQSQPSFLGEGYTATQLSFFNGQNTVDFQPVVEQYWNSYIQNEKDLSPYINNQSTDMGIWLNSFPLGFDKQVQLKSSSFVANSPVAANLSSTDLQSASLKRDVGFNFNQDLAWKYTNNALSTLSSSNGNSVPAQGSQGQIISQGIISLF